MKFKRSEVGDFFGNNVWNVHRSLEPERGRVLELRWSKKERWFRSCQCQTRADRIQYPGALAGRIATNSTVTSRLGKNLCFIVAASERWRLQCAYLKTAVLLSALQTRRPHVQLHVSQGFDCSGNTMCGQLDTHQQWFCRARSELLQVGLR